MQEQDVADIKTYKSVEDYPRDVLPTQVMPPTSNYALNVMCVWWDSFNVMCDESFLPLNKYVF